jgi:ribokinase
MSPRPHPAPAGLVVVVGSINVDVVVAADRLPGPGETVVGRRHERHGGGKGANAAVAAARAGATVTLIGAVGRDETAEFALRELEQAGIDLIGVGGLEAEPTGIALIAVDPEGENQIAVGAGANAALDTAWVRERMAAALPEAGCVLVSTEIAPAAVAAAVRAAAGAGVLCLLNTAPPIPVVLELLDCGPILTPNARELERLCAMLDDLPEATGPEERAIALALRTGSPVVVTLGGDGALIADADGGVERIPALGAVAVLDTTGAGDTFNGVLAACLAVGEPLVSAVRSAVAAGSLSVSRRGARTGMPSAAEIDAAVRQAAGTVVA